MNKYLLSTLLLVWVLLIGLSLVPSAFADPLPCHRIHALDAYPHFKYKTNITRNGLFFINWTLNEPCQQIADYELAVLDAEGTRLPGTTWRWKTTTPVLVGHLMLALDAPLKANTSYTIRYLRKGEPVAGQHEFVTGETLLPTTVDTPHMGITEARYRPPTERIPGAVCYFFYRWSNNDLPHGQVLHVYDPETPATDPTSPLPYRILWSRPTSHLYTPHQQRNFAQGDPFCTLGKRCFAYRISNAKGELGPVFQSCTELISPPAPTGCHSTPLLPYSLLSLLLLCGLFRRR